MAPTYIVNIVSIIVATLALVGIDVVPSDVETTVVTIVFIATGLFTLYRQIKTGRSTIFGTRPQ